MTGHKTPKTKALTAEDAEDAEDNPEPKNATVNCPAGLSGPVRQFCYALRSY